MDEKGRRLLTSERLTSLIKEKYGSHGDHARTKEFIFDVNEKDKNIRMNKNLLSPILHGKKPLNDRNAAVFAEVLNVDVAYIKGFQDYPSKQDELNEQWAKFETLMNEASNDTIWGVKAIDSLAKLNGYSIVVNNPNKKLDGTFNGLAEYFDARKMMLVFKKNGAEDFTMSDNDMICLINNLSDYFCSYVKWNIKKGK